MFVLCGLRVRSKTLSEGLFHCPREQAERAYHHRSARRWLTVLLVPVVPLAALDDYVECTTCRATYGRSVLAVQSAA